MPGDMVVALGRVTVDGHALFAVNTDGGPNDCQVLVRVPGQEHALGEKVRARGVELPQPRQTYTVLGSAAPGEWGFRHGVNEHGLAVGCGSHPTRLAAPAPGLGGTDLVRLALERTRQAARAVGLILDLVERHGQAEGGGDASFLVADDHEAFLIETAGAHWVQQEIGQVRAAGDLSTVRQDWVRISRGLAGHAIERGWWPADGSKLDFAAAVAPDPVGRESALCRWGRATYLLEQQSGHIDVGFLRRLMSDHYEGMRDECDPLRPGPGPLPLCQHGPGRFTAASMVAPLRDDPAAAPLAWCAFGPPCLGVYFPVFLDGELPAPFQAGGPEPSAQSVWWRTRVLHEQLCGHEERAAEVCAAFDRLQARFDQEAEECAAEAARNDPHRRADWSRRAGLFVQHCLERYLDTLRQVARPEYEYAAARG